MRPHRWQLTRLPQPWDSSGKNTGVGCHFLLQCMRVKSESEVVQSCLTPSDPMDCSLPGSSIHGIFQARVLEWGAIAFSVDILYFHPIMKATLVVTAASLHIVDLWFLISPSYWVRVFFRMEQGSWWTKDPTDHFTWLWLALGVQGFRSTLIAWAGPRPLMALQWDISFYRSFWNIMCSDVW